VSIKSGSRAMPKLTKRVIDAAEIHAAE